jgi:hypothetical protein
MSDHLPLRDIMTVFNDMSGGARRRRRRRRRREFNQRS